MVRITNIRILNDYHIHFCFSDGCEKIIDFKKFIRDDAITKQLEDEEFFSKVKIYDNGRGIYWPNDYDFCPDNLRYYMQSESLSTKVTA